MCVLGWFVEVGPSRDLLLHTVAYSATHTLAETVPDCHSTWILMEHTRPYSHHLSWWFEKNSNYYCTKNIKACMCVICMCVYFCSLVLCYHLLRKHSNIPSDRSFCRHKESVDSNLLLYATHYFTYQKKVQDHICQYKTHTVLNI